MKKIIGYSILILFIVGCSGEDIYKSTMKARMAMGNFTLKNKLLDNGLNMAYYENNVKSDKTLVLVHGFTEDKDTWLEFAHGLWNKYHIIIPDQIGYGDSSKPININYSMDIQSNRLKEFLDTFTNKKIVLIGASMGGGVAIKYASKYDVESLVLIASMGLKGETKPYFEKLSKDERNNLIFNVCSRQKMKNILNVYMERAPYIPLSVIDYLAEVRCNNNDLIKHQSQYIYDENFDVQYTLLADIQEINVPTMIVWGKSDKALHVSSAYAFHKTMNNSFLKIYNNVGHLVMREVPYRLAFDVATFLRK